MKPLLALALLPFLSVPLLSLRAPQEGQRPEKEHHEESELEEHMERIERSVKALRRSLRDPALAAESLQTLAEIQAQTLACKPLTPAATARLPEGEREAFVKAYRKAMIDFLTRQLELEAALLEGDEEAVKTAFDAFREMEDPSHERFAPEDD